MRGAALPGLFRKLLDKPRLTSWADVILGRRGQVRVISGQGGVGVCVWGGLISRAQVATGPAPAMWPQAGLVH